jgi:hypothetical protein
MPKPFRGAMSRKPGKRRGTLLGSWFPVLAEISNFAATYAVTVRISSQEASRIPVDYLNAVDGET